MAQADGTPPVFSVPRGQPAPLDPPAPFVPGGVSDRGLPAKEAGEATPPEGATVPRAGQEVPAGGTLSSPKDKSLVAIEVGGHALPTPVDDQPELLIIDFDSFDPAWAFANRARATDDFRLEGENLDRLSADGLPVPKTWNVVNASFQNGANGPHVVLPAVITDAFKEWSGNILVKRNNEYLLSRNEHLNGVSIEDLVNIKKTLNEKNIGVDGLEFAAGEDGHVVIFAARAVYPGDQVATDPMSELPGGPTLLDKNNELIDALIETAEESEKPPSPGVSQDTSAHSRGLPETATLRELLDNGWTPGSKGIGVTSLPRDASAVLGIRFSGGEAPRIPPEWEAAFADIFGISENLENLKEPEGLRAKEVALVMMPNTDGGEPVYRLYSGAEDMVIPPAVGIPIGHTHPRGHWKPSGGGRQAQLELSRRRQESTAGYRTHPPGGRQPYLAELEDQRRYLEENKLGPGGTRFVISGVAQHTPYLAGVSHQE
jgi:hypothetical protein